MLPDDCDFSDITMYKNLQFKGNIDNIEWIELQVGGYKIDRINMVFYKTLQKFYKMDGIPFYSFKYGHLMAPYHPTNILFKVRKPANITLQLDKYNKQIINFKMEQLLYRNYYYDLLVNTKKKDNDICLPFNHQLIFFFAIIN